MWSQSKSPGFELAGRGVAAIRNAHRAAHAEAALGEVESVAHGPADAVEWTPLDERSVHAALQNKIFDQPAHVIVGKRSADRRLQAEAAAQSARDVVFAAAFPDFEFARRAHAAFARIEPEHDFAESNQVVLARTGRFDV